MKTSSNRLWIFFRNGLLLLLAIILFDQLIGAVLHQMYFSQKNGPAAETTFTFTKMNQDVIILGSSRGRRNYNPQYIADSLGISCYNAGHDGQTIFYEQAIVRLALSRYAPKLVILDLNPEEMYYKEVHYDRLNVLAPYYQDYPEVRDIYLLKGIRDRKPAGKILVGPSESVASAFWMTHGAMDEYVIPVNAERYKMMSMIYRYNSSLLDILTGIFKNRKSDAGFKPLKGVISKQKADELIKENAKLRNEKNKTVDPKKVKGLEEIFTTLTAKGTKVYVSMSPALAPFAMEPSYQAIQEVCSKYNIPFKDYSQDLQYNKLDYFFDNHMNKDGANLFSQNLASDLRKIISNQ
ncbi:MAG: hypothetical protein ABI729_05630 [Chitinophagales bacterium]